MTRDQALELLRARGYLHFDHFLVTLVELGVVKFDPEPVLDARSIIQRTLDRGFIINAEATKNKVDLAVLILEALEQEGFYVIHKGEHIGITLSYGGRNTACCGKVLDIRQADQSKTAP